MKNMTFGLAVASAVFVAGCVSSNSSPYRDPTEVRGTTTEFSSYDFQQCAAAMVDSMLANANLDGRLKEQFASKRPVVSIMPVENKTFRIFDLRPMTDTIQSRLVNSGKFDFTDRSAEKMMTDEMTHDMDSVMIADDQAAAAKTHAAADYLLTGVLAEIRDAGGRTHESYYKLTMKLFNRRTGKIDWSAEKELRKVGTRPVLGW